MIGTPAPAPEGLAALLPGYLGRQRWYAGDGAPAAVEVLSCRRLPAPADLWWLVVGDGAARYQLLLGQRPGGNVPDAMAGNERAVLGAAGDCTWYDAVVDPELALGLLAMISGGAQAAARVRPITAEQSNTSLVYDDRVILKVFRRLLDGPNPDVEVTTALAEGGFEHVARPVAAWREGGTDLMFAQEYLVGGSEGWALALTSLRDFYSAVDDDPAEAGGDLAGEARRLGRVTARMHLVLAATYGVGRLAGGAWTALVDDIERRLSGVEGLQGAGAAVDRLRRQPDGGPAIRVHGDYHLGQVMRTDGGWYVLDFEGEPARALEERLVPTSPLKDVTGMLRSFHYASRVAMRERDGEDLEQRALAWERHTRAAFLAGYHDEPGITDLLPAGGAETVVADAFELDKALYELGYERAYRPDWVDIPLGAVTRLLGAA